MADKSKQSPAKQEFIEKSLHYWNPGKTQFWQDAGIDLVIDRREGYLLHDLSGRRLIDMHLNGGTYNLGHRNPELVQALKDGLDHFDMGNHHFPALCRTALAEELHRVSPPSLRYCTIRSSGAAISWRVPTTPFAAGFPSSMASCRAAAGRKGR